MIISHLYSFSSAVTPAFHKAATEMDCKSASVCVRWGKAQCSPKSANNPSPHLAAPGDAEPRKSHLLWNEFSILSGKAPLLRTAGIIKCINEGRISSGCVDVCSKSCHPSLPGGSADPSAALGSRTMAPVGSGWELWEQWPEQKPLFPLRNGKFGNPVKTFFFPCL